MAEFVSIFIFTMFMKLLYFNRLIGSADTSNTFIVSSIGALLLFTFFIPMLNNKWKNGAIILANIIITFVIISDLVFFRYFNDIITVPIITQANMVSSVSNSVLNLFHYCDLLFVADFLFILPLLKAAKPSKRRIKNSWISKTLISVTFAAIGLYMSYVGVNLLEQNQPHILTTFYDKSYIVQNIGLINYHVIDAYKFIRENTKSKEPLGDNEKNQIKFWFKEKNQSIDNKPRYFGIGRGKNLIVIQVEALQEFVIGKKINGSEITPNLNKLIKKSMYFKNYYCETAAGGTSDAEFLVNTSLYPLKTGAVFMKYPGNNYNSLPKILKDEGYSTIAMHAYKPGFWNRSVMYPNLGFDEFFNKTDLVHDEVIGMGVSDKSFFKQSLEHLETIKEPYYSFMVTLTSHYPYDNTKSYNNYLSTGDLKGTFLGNYLEAIHYADESLGYLINSLDKEGMIDNTVIAIYGDHYAISKDRKEELAKFLNINDMNDYMWVKHQKVPLIIHLPGDEGAGLKSIVGGGLDLMPTLLNIMGIDGKTMPMMGRDLLNSKQGMAVMRNGYFIDDNYLCLTADGVAFNLKTGKPYSIENLQDKINDMHKELDISEKIIENDLIKEIKEYLIEQVVD